MTLCERCSNIIPDGILQCPTCGHKVGEVVENVENEQLPMRWYKFTVNFILILIPFILIIFGVLLMRGLVWDGILYLTSDINELDLETMYTTLSEEGFSSIGNLVHTEIIPLAIFDTICGALYVLVGAFSYYVRRQLVKKKKNSGNIVGLLPVFIALLSIVSLFGSSFIFELYQNNEAIISLNEISLLILTVVLICGSFFYANKVYYYKRRDMFIN